MSGQNSALITEETLQKLINRDLEGAKFHLDMLQRFLKRAHVGIRTSNDEALKDAKLECNGIPLIELKLQIQALIKEMT